MDKNIIPKKTYRAIYRLLDSVSPADFDCGQLCGAVCCLSESDDMGIYPVKKLSSRTAETGSNGVHKMRKNAVFRNPGKDRSFL